MWYRAFCALAVIILGGCGGGGGSTPCPAAQTLLIVGYSTGGSVLTGGLSYKSSPFPSTATFLYFSISTYATYGNIPEPVTEAGNPILTGSDGSKITGGPLVPNEVFDIVNYTSFGYSSSVAGLKPDVQYSVSFPSLVASPGGCRYGSEAGGTFFTN